QVQQRAWLGADEARGEQDELAGHLPAAAGDAAKGPSAVVPGGLDIYGDHGADPTGLVAEELDGLTAPGLDDSFLVRGRGLVHLRPLRPGVRDQVTRIWWARVVVELGDARRALAVRGAEAVGGGVATTDDHDVLACRVEG